MLIISDDFSKYIVLHFHIVPLLKSMSAINLHWSSLIWFYNFQCFSRVHEVVLAVSSNDIFGKIEDRN